MCWPFLVVRASAGMGTRPGIGFYINLWTIVGLISIESRQKISSSMNQGPATSRPPRMSPPLFEQASRQTNL